MSAGRTRSAQAPFRRRLRLHWGDILIGAVIIAIGLIVFVPLLWMTLSSFKSLDETLTPVVRWIPSQWHFSNYSQVFDDNEFGTYFKNSVVVAASVTVINLTISSLAGYGLAKFAFPGRTLLLLFVLAILMIPFQVIVVPVYIVVRQLGWINSYWGLIVPGGVSAFGIFFMRQTISVLPNELFEAARLDGAGEFLIYLRILLPLSSPSLAALAVLTFLGSWNNLLWPLLVIQSDGLKTLPLGLAQMATGQYGVQYNLLMTGAVISSIPVMVVFLATRRYFVRGISAGAIK